jgi:hypothetical protein
MAAVETALLVKGLSLPGDPKKGTTLSLTRTVAQ